jgi:hypothetical protein
MTAARRKAVREHDSTKEMTALIEQSCLVAKDAAFNLRDFLENSSNMASIADGAHHRRTHHQCDHAGHRT